MLNKTAGRQAGLSFSRRALAGAASWRGQLERACQGAASCAGGVPGGPGKPDDATVRRPRGDVVTWCGCATGSATQPEEEAFGEVVAQLMQGHLSAPQAVRAFAAVCQNRADQLRCAACRDGRPDSGPAALHACRARLACTALLRCRAEARCAGTRRRRCSAAAPAALARQRARLPGQGGGGRAAAPPGARAGAPRARGRAGGGGCHLVAAGAPARGPPARLPGRRRRPAPGRLRRRADRAAARRAPAGGRARPELVRRLHARVDPHPAPPLPCQPHE